MKRTALVGFGVGFGLAPCVGLVLALGTSLAVADATASQQRRVPAFHGVDVGGILEVEVTLGKPASVEVSADADLIDKIVTTVKDGVLVFTTPELEHVRLHNRHLRAFVTAPDVDSVAISGVGSIKLTGVANEQLAISVSGTGSIKTAGSTGSLHARVSGTGDISARDLSARDVVISIGGTGSAQLVATRSVDARVSGTGSVHVQGHPAQVKKHVSGLGSIHVE